VIAHQIRIDNQVAKASTRSQHRSQPLPTVARTVVLPSIATQQPLAIFTGARSALRHQRCFSSCHPLTNQFSASPPDEPVLGKHTSALFPSRQAHAFKPNGPPTWILTSTFAKSFGKHVARLAHSVITDSLEHSPDQICLGISPKNVFLRHKFLKTLRNARRNTLCRVFRFPRKCLEAPIVPSHAEPTTTGTTSHATPTVRAS
jgi:hypothetical protein